MAHLYKLSFMVRPLLHKPSQTRLHHISFCPFFMAGPHKTLYNRFIRWSRLGVFDRIFVALTEQAGRSKRLMIDATHLKAHRTSASLLKKGLFPAISDGQKAV